MPIEKVGIDPIVARRGAGVAPDFIAGAELAVHTQCSGPTWNGFAFKKELCSTGVDDMQVYILVLGGPLDMHQQKGLGELLRSGLGALPMMFGVGLGRMHRFFGGVLSRFCCLRGLPCRFFSRTRLLQFAPVIDAFLFVVGQQDDHDNQERSHGAGNYIQHGEVDFPVTRFHCLFHAFKEEGGCGVVVVTGRGVVQQDSFHRRQPIFWRVRLSKRRFHVGFANEFPEAVGAQ